MCFPFRQIKYICTVLAIFVFFPSPLNVLAAPEYNCTSGKHKYIETSRIPSTATTDGEVSYRCELCGKVWDDILFATNHVWTEWVVDKDATCTKQGERHRSCSRGASHDQYETLPALGHDYKEAITTVPDCETPGVKTITCTRCHESHTETILATGHDYDERITKEPSCFEDGEKTYIDKNNSHHNYTKPIPAYGAHDFGEWFVETPAEEGVPGIEARICTRNPEHKETRKITALPANQQKPEPILEPEIEKFFFNTGDLVIGGINLGFLGMFTALIAPYVKSSIYIRKRRKYIQRIKELRELVSKHYDFE